ncbi:DUF4393 domain-containing protein [Pontibacter sp. HSC-36F09]|uniref:DUF4393 domain-containing protein n=1 Tax=Pontibacter sp. HSC-36F09 TaxID=2910966 RepID=UPI0020A109BC|nr:DUF4393 domain-containing protein [Pontibacter sp. HSC-36F09]MCP2044887.1 hypothetical protein [Pontibacter sp. HSC-36F09]
MSNELSKPDSNVKSTIEAATGLVKAIPIYQDAIQPSAQQIGKSLETITKTVNIALAPIKVLVWGYEQIEQFVSNRVAEKLSKVPEENIVTPPPQVAGPAIEALKYSGHDENLRELFANLLATAMDKATIHSAHPGYVEIIKNLTSDEAVLLSAFVDKSVYPIININAKSKDENGGFILKYPKYSHLHKAVTVSQVTMLPSYLDNLCRLGILESPSGLSMTAPNTYEPLEIDEELAQLKSEIVSDNYDIDFKRGLIRPTSYGKQFIQNVVISK